MKSEFEPGFSTFTGVEVRPDGTRHQVHRLTCNGCGATLSEMHYGCCGHGACGFGTARHECEKEGNDEVGL